MNTDALAEKTLVMLVGPVATGKSTIIQAASALDETFSYVQSFTSRAQRDVNDNSYMFLPLDTVKQLHESGQTVTFIEHPTTGDLYGTTADSYATEYSVLDTLFNTVQTYRSLPFKNTIVVSITTSPDAWKKFFMARFPYESEDGKKRLEEARLSTQWSLSQSTDHYWLVNDGSPEEVARKLIAIARGTSKGDVGEPIARELLETLSTNPW